MINFTIRKSKPGAGNKHYIRSADGGYSNCIKGNPTDKNCNVLSNCVGYAIGRSSEIYSEITGYKGNYFNFLQGDAENFYSKAKKKGLTLTSYPVAGGIMVWSKGKVGVNKDGAGHVAVVEIDYGKDAKKVYTSESAYNGSAFYNKTRSKGNGNWGMSSSYKYLGCINNPAVKNISVAESVNRDELKNQFKVIATELRVRVDHNTTSTIVGIVKTNAIYNYLDTYKDSKYIWYKIAAEQWVADNGKYLEIYLKKEESKMENDGTEKILELEKNISDLNNKIVDKDAKITHLEKLLNEQEKQTCDFMDEVKKLKEELENNTCKHKLLYTAQIDAKYWIRLRKGEALYIEYSK